MISSTIIFLTSTIGVFWSVAFLFVGVLGIRLYKVSDNELAMFLKAHIKHASIWDNEEPEGWIIGYPYIGYIQAGYGGYGRSDRKVATILTTVAFYTKHIKHAAIGRPGGAPKPTDPSIPVTKERTITCVNKEGSYYDKTFKKRERFIPKRDPRPAQQATVDDILKTYDALQHCVCLVTGEPGGGKSVLSDFLGKSLLDRKEVNNVCLVRKFDPTVPNGTFEDYYSNIMPSQQKPLVFLIDEIDCIVEKFKTSEIKDHASLPVEVRDKTGWNRWLDDIDNGYYPHVILILTSNRDEAFFDAIDPSLTRPGRINIKHKISLLTER